MRRERMEIPSPSSLSEYVEIAADYRITWSHPVNTPEALVPLSIHLLGEKY